MIFSYLLIIPVISEVFKEHYSRQEKKEDLESVTTQDPHFGLFLLIFHYRFCNNKSILSLILPKVPPALLRVWQLGHGMVNRIRSSVLPYGRILRKMGHRRARRRCQV